jgi:hypothetical protein
MTAINYIKKNKDGFLILIAYIISYVPFGIASTLTKYPPFISMMQRIIYNICGTFFFGSCILFPILIFMQIVFDLRIKEKDNQ